MKVHFHFNSYTEKQFHIRQKNAGQASVQSINVESEALLGASPLADVCPWTPL